MRHEYKTELMHKEYEYALEVMQNTKCHRLVRQNGVTSKFYSYNNRIVRIDLTNRCTNIIDIKII